MTRAALRGIVRGGYLRVLDEDEQCAQVPRDPVAQPPLRRFAVALERGPQGPPFRFIGPALPTPRCRIGSGTGGGALREGVDGIRPAPQRGMVPVLIDHLVHV